MGTFWSVLSSVWSFLVLTWPVCPVRSFWSILSSYPVLLRLPCPFQSCTAVSFPAMPCDALSCLACPEACPEPCPYLPCLLGPGFSCMLCVPYRVLACKYVLSRLVLACFVLPCPARPSSLFLSVWSCPAAMPLILKSCLVRSCLVLLFPVRSVVKLRSVQFFQPCLVLLFCPVVHLILSCPVLLYPDLRCCLWILSRYALPWHALSRHVMLCPVCPDWSCPELSCHVLSYGTLLFICLAARPCPVLSYHPVLPVSFAPALTQTLTIELFCYEHCEQHARDGT